MSFTYSLQYLLSNVLWVLALPGWFLEICPWAVPRKAYKAYHEVGIYMRDMVAEKQAAVRSGNNDDVTIDLLGQLVKERREEGSNGTPIGVAALSPSEIVGNLFIFYMAGHETSANSIHFSLLLLALHPQVQRTVQGDLDRVFQGRSVQEWDYDRDIPALLGGLLGAVLAEELRLIAPVIAIPKTTGSVSRRLTINGKEVTLPANTMLRLAVHAAHRNPKFWPHGPPRDAARPYFPPGNPNNDLEEFKPERWITRKHDVGTGDIVSQGSSFDDVALGKGSFVPSSLYTPVKGAYLPFSDGPRACLGRRFAQVEIMAALAVILTEYSVELAVDEWASDEEVAKMSNTQRKETWRKAEEKANWTWQNKMGCIITLQLRGARVPMRFVRRGYERFSTL